MILADLHELGGIQIETVDEVFFVVVNREELFVVLDEAVIIKFHKAIVGNHKLVGVKRGVDIKRIQRNLNGGAAKESFSIKIAIDGQALRPIHREQAAGRDVESGHDQAVIEFDIIIFIITVVPAFNIVERQRTGGTDLDEVGVVPDHVELFGNALVTFLFRIVRHGVRCCCSQDRRQQPSAVVCIAVRRSSSGCDRMDITCENIKV